MAVELPMVEVRRAEDLQEALMELEPLQPARLKTPRRAQDHVPALRGLPNVKLSPRFARASAWVPPTAQPGSEVVVYHVGDTGLRTEGVEPARVVAYLPGERQVLVRLCESGDCKAVPMSWVLDPALAGTPRHPWRAGCAPQAPAAASAASFPSGPIAPGPENLREALLATYGSTVDAWEAIDAQGLGEARLEAFLLACRRLRYRGDLAAAFAEIDEEGSGAITLRSFRRWVVRNRGSGEQVARPAAVAAAAAGPSAGGPLAAARAGVRAPGGGTAGGGDRHAAAARQGARLFKLLMSRQFNSLAEAWLEFDTNHDGVLQFREFCAAARRLNFRGNLRLIWDYLVGGTPDFDDEDDRVLPPEGLDPRLPTLLETFRAQGSMGCRRLLQDQAPQRRLVARCPPVWPAGGTSASAGTAPVFLC